MDLWAFITFESYNTNEHVYSFPAIVLYSNANGA